MEDDLILPNVLEAEIEYQMQNGCIKAVVANELGHISVSMPSSATYDQKATSNSPGLLLSYSALLPGADLEELSTGAYLRGEHLDQSTLWLEEVEWFKITSKELGQNSARRRICIDSRIIQLAEGGWAKFQRVSDRDQNIHVVTHKGVYECPIQEAEYK